MKVNQILLYEEGSIDEEKHREALEACGIYLLPFRAEAKTAPYLLDVGPAPSSVSAIGYEITSERDLVDDE